MNPRRAGMPVVKRSLTPDMFKPCVIIPVFEHCVPLEMVLAKLRPYQLTCLVIDDGSGAACRRALQTLAAAPDSMIILTRLDSNGGKGAAVKAGLRRAAKMGFSHAVQVDADGQHDMKDLLVLLAAAEQEPAAVICGLPVFDASVPALRLHARKLTNLWVRINTLSNAIPDAMCGLRIYPLDATIAIIDTMMMGNRMDFDPELLVRLTWAGCTLRFLPVSVKYPVDGVSHFRMGMDNVLISWMHTRLFFGMLLRIIPLLRRVRT
jgi:glycosyltransferase involved in cell wall biosynthesis